MADQKYLIEPMDRWHIVRRLAGALALLVIVISFGTIGFQLVEGWSLLDSLYMTVITVTTIGFGEVHTLDHHGRIFTIVLALTGAGTAAYALTSLATVVVGGELARIIKGRQMQRDIKSLQNHIVLCGCGRTGSCALRDLQAGGETVLVIEKDVLVCEDLTVKGVPVICDDATLEHVLERARVRHAKGLITALPDDADNVFVTLTAREMSPGLCVISRASHQKHENKLRRAGATRIVFVNEVAGRHMANILLMPEAIRFLDNLTGMANREVGLSEIMINPTCDWNGKTLSEAHIRARTGLNVFAIRHANGEMVIDPGADTRMCEGDVLVVFGPLKNAAELNATFTGAR